MHTHTNTHTHKHTHTNTLTLCDKGHMHTCAMDAEAMGVA